MCEWVEVKGAEDTLLDDVYFENHQQRFLWRELKFEWHEVLRFEQMLWKTNSGEKSTLFIGGGQVLCFSS